MSVVAKVLSPWLTRWAPAGLVGGLAERSGEIMHGRIHHDAFVSNAADFAMLSEDLEKFFDSLHIGQCVALWRKMGAQISLCLVILRFYK